MTEKILAKASDRATLEPGDNIWVNVDVLMTHDVCGPGTFGIFKREFGQNAKVVTNNVKLCQALSSIDILLPQRLQKLF